MINPYATNIGLENDASHYLPSIPMKKGWDRLTNWVVTLLFLQSTIVTALCIKQFGIRAIGASPEIAFWLPVIGLLFLRFALRRFAAGKEIVTFVIALLTSGFLGIVFWYLNWNEQYVLRKSDNILSTCFKLVLTSENVWFSSLLLSYAGLAVFIFRKLMFLRTLNVENSKVPETESSN